MPQATVSNPNKAYVVANGVAYEHYGNYNNAMIGDVANIDLVYVCQINGTVSYLSRSPNQAFLAVIVGSTSDSVFKYELSGSMLVDGVSVYYHSSPNRPSDTIDFTRNFTSIEEAAEYIYNLGRYPITYRLTNCTAPNAPSEASIGDTVRVPLVFPEGYGIVNNANVYVTNNGAIVSSTYSDGVLTFEMPDPN